MVNCMAAPPRIVGRKGQHPQHATDPVIRQSVAKERTMAAVMLNHEQSDEQTGGRNCERQRQPPEAEINRRPSQCPQGAANGISVIAISKMLRAWLGSRYCARIVIHRRASLRREASVHPSVKTECLVLRRCAPRSHHDCYHAPASIGTAFRPVKTHTRALFQHRGTASVSTASSGAVSVNERA